MAIQHEMEMLIEIIFLTIETQFDSKSRHFAV